MDRRKHYSGVATLFGLGSFLPSSFPSTFILLWTIPLGGSGEGLLPPAILLCMCATVVYPPGLLHCMKGRLSFILRWRGRPLEEIPILNIKIELCFD
jgi:hypothetical protein